jgi:predicted transcriptional regulator
MARYTRRVQSVLSEEQYEELSRIAEQRDQPLSVLIREAVKETYLEKRGTRRRLEAVERITSLDAPVSDWEQMEEEIIRGAGE